LRLRGAHTLEKEPLIPKHGGYRNLKSFQIAQLVYDVTVRFCDRYVQKRSRTHDQMVQAARSGVQNIGEGSQAAGTSKKTELKLTNVARASLEELHLDYEDFLRQRGLPLWQRNDPRRARLIARRCKTADEVAAWVQEQRGRSGQSGQNGRDGFAGEEGNRVAANKAAQKSEAKSTQSTSSTKSTFPPTPSSRPMPLWYSSQWPPACWIASSLRLRRPLSEKVVLLSDFTGFALAVARRVDSGTQGQHEQLLSSSQAEIGCSSCTCSRGALMFRNCGITSCFLLLSSLLGWGQEPISLDPGSGYTACRGTPTDSQPCVTPPRLIHKADPIYPPDDIKSKIEGTVLLDVVIGNDGNLRDIRVSRSLKPSFDQAAVAAVRQWQFEPGRYQGKAVAIYVHMEINFRVTPGTNSQPDTGSASLGTSPQQVQNLFAAAGDAYNRHDYADAAKLARQVTELAPRHRAAWNLIGLSLFALNQDDAAVDALKKQIEVDLANQYAYNNLGRVYNHQHKYDLAIEQFRKQLAINPQDRYVPLNLGLALYSQKKYSDAAAEFEKALEITPSNASALLGLAECHLELGQNEKALDEFSRATSAASSPAVWNNAAYQLATHNLQLDRAQKWAESAAETESAMLRDVSLDRITPVQMDRVRSLATIWDTLGWVDFVRGDLRPAESYLRAAWQLHPDATVGDHLGQVYEKLDCRDDALRTYAMALASEDISQETSEQESRAKLRGKMAELAGAEFNPASLNEAGTTQLAGAQSLAVPNSGKATGTGDFLLLIAAPDRIVDARQLNGDAALQPMNSALRATKFPLDLPASADVQIPRRGTLTCTPEHRDCQLALLTAAMASELARKEAGSDTAAKVIEAAGKPNLFHIPALGMDMTLPEGFTLVSQQSPSLTQPATAIFQKAGTLATIFMFRHHLEATPELYRKMVEDNDQRREEFVRTSAAPVTRDGIQGDHWNVQWKENGIAFRAIVEFFSIEDEHYMVIAQAPAETFPRYSKNFEEALESVKLPAWRVSAGEILSKSK
jgi:four helix bundle protein